VKFLTCKQAARAWDVAVTKATQAGDPAFAKIGRVMLMYPLDTTQEIAYWTAHASREVEEELCLREAMAMGRVDRERIHPSAQTSKRPNIERLRPDRASTGSDGKPACGDLNPTARLR
jgi:hypothetical protein